MTTEIEAVAQIRGWVEEDRELAALKRRASETIANQVVALRYFSGLAVTEADRGQIQAQAAELEDAGNADDAAASTLEATAEGWESILEAIETQAPSS